MVVRGGKMRLSDLGYLQEAEIISVEMKECAYLKRLRELGFLKGTMIVPLYRTLFGGIRAYWLKGAVIAVRDADAKKITVKAI